MIRYPRIIRTRFICSVRYAKVSSLNEEISLRALLAEEVRKEAQEEHMIWSSVASSLRRTREDD